ncbi:hypothetical protein LZS85_09385 [Aliivibrio fischeri]|uniref:hypothetical protein n=1 Tax=Aliivibrio fischeri TaxID=668 RepID=UPI001F2DB83C|nr:hypothetical protein [Aliivibrio fischeri]MCE7566320.1 hypothetical protein [Aliivibrio fischeri]
MENYKYRFDKALLINRPYGLSAFIRLKNGADTISFTIDSHIAIFDEIVIVLNGCTDNSLEICESYKNMYPDLIKIYIYEPEVYPFGSKEHKKEPFDSIHSFVNFSNFALQKTSFSHVMKLDDDHYCPISLQNKEMFLSGFDDDKVNYFSGVNLTWDSDGDVAINSDYPLAGNGDHFIIKLNENTYFKKNDICEYFSFDKLEFNYLGLRYFHLKYLRRNYGFSNVLNTVRGNSIKQSVEKSGNISIEQFIDAASKLAIIKNNGDIHYLFRLYRGIKWIGLRKLILLVLAKNKKLAAIRGLMLSDNMVDIINSESKESLTARFGCLQSK